MTFPVEVHRVYDDRGGRSSDYRALVDRLWPRGVSKDSLWLDEWAKDAAPTSELRKWYGHDPGLFDEFSTRYLAELRRQPAAGAVEAIIEAAAGRSRLVLLTATKDVTRSGAAVLAAHVTAMLGRRR